MSDQAQTGNGMDLSADDLGLLSQLLAEAGVDDAHVGGAIRPREAGTRVPLSFAQELLWLLDQASPGLTAYNVSAARRLMGPLDRGILEQSVTAVVARHEALRTRLALVDGEPAQIVDAPASITLDVVDLSTLPAAEHDAATTRVLQERLRTPFTLAQEHLFRATLVQRSETDHVLLIVTHHAVCDGWSLGVFFNDLAAYYRAVRRGATPSLPALSIQYGDFAAWQREQLRGERLERLLAFWRGQLGDVTEPLDLPTDFPRPATPTFVGARRSVLIPAELFAAVKQLGRNADATLYMTLLATYATVLHRYSGQDRILIGSAVAGRTEQETEGVIGYFNNTLVQRADFSGDPTFAELLTRVRDSALGAYDHQDVPLEKLILELREGQDRFGDAPLFQVVFTMQDTIGSAVELDDVEMRPFGVELGATKFELTLLPAEREDGLLLTVRYRSDLFSPATIDRFLGHFRQVLESAVANPSRRISALPMLTEPELADLAAWNATAANRGGLQSVYAQFAAQAARRPGATAVVCGDAQVTYQQLDERANRLARELRDTGVGRETAVGLCLERSIDAIVGILGIFKAGGAYVPLAPDLPPARLAEQIAQADVRTVVTTSAHRERLPDSALVLCVDTFPATTTEDDTPRSTTDIAALDDLAYVLFTSGSTGTPKGVAVTHRNLAQYTSAIRERLELPADQSLHFASVSSLGADLGNTAIFPALTTGGILHLLPEQVTTEPARYAEYLAAHPIDVLKITPNHLRALIAGRSGHELAPLLPRRWLVFGGEALTWELASQVGAAGTCRVLNHYGPTEATVGCATFEVTAASTETARGVGAQTVPVGRPLANVRLVVLDAYRQLVPVTVPGELYIAGDGVARGYLGQATMTAERFVELPGVGRAYRTGDRVRRLPTGDLEFLGRLDQQVKIRGFRVELGEIEQVLSQHPDLVHVAALIQHTDATAEPTLVAYVVPKAGGYASAHAEQTLPARVQSFAAERLPSYMVPATIIALHELPLTSNGKLDRQALAAQHAPGVTRSRVAPRTEMEERLVQLWADVLKRESDSFGVTDDFLALGGHSLIAIRLLGKLSRSFGVRLPLRALFEAPTIEALAELLDIEIKLAALEQMEGAGGETSPLSS